MLADALPVFELGDEAMHKLLRFRVTQAQAAKTQPR